MYDSLHRNHDLLLQSKTGTTCCLCVSVNSLDKVMIENILWNVYNGPPKSPACCPPITTFEPLAKCCMFNSCSLESF